MDTRKFLTAVLPAFVVALVLACAVFFTACNGSVPEDGNYNTEQGGENEPNINHGTNPGGGSEDSVQDSNEDNEDELHEIVATAISLNKLELTLEEGEEYTLIATISPANTTDKSITWTSSKISVVTVTNGKVTAKEAGVATITARTRNGKIAVCTVIVEDLKSEVIEVTSVSLDKTSLTLDIGETATLSATLMPANATDKSITWMSINENIVKVVDGTIYPINEGKTTVYVITSNNLKASCEVIIKRNVPIQGIILNNGEDICLLTNEEMKVSGKYWPANATDSITITSSDESIMEVILDSQGIRIKAINAGSAKLIASATSGASSEITVNIYECSVKIPNAPLSIYNLDWDHIIVYTGTLTTIEGSLSIYDSVTYGYCFSLDLKIVGKVTQKYFDPPNNFKIAYKIIDDNSIVLASGTLQTIDISVGDTFIIETSILITNDLTNCNYTLQLDWYVYDYIIGY